MSDAALRQLEVRFRATAAVEDEAAWLRARVRAGELGEDRLALAGYLGHEAARRVSGEVSAPAEPVAWLEGIAAHGAEALARARFAVAWEAAHLWDEGGGRPSLVALATLLDAWVECPCGPHRSRLRRGTFRLVSELDLDGISYLPQRQARAMLQVVLGTACWVARVSTRRLQLPPGFEPKSPASRPLTYGGLTEFVVAALRLMSPDELCAIVTDYVAPWALGDQARS